MTRFTILGLVGALAAGPSLLAQAPARPAGPPPNRTPNSQASDGPMGPPMGPRMAGPMGPPMGPPAIDAASMLLAHTGEFKLTDAQVTRLAAIARRTADRHKAMMASMDSMVRARDGAAVPAGANATRPEPTPAMRAQFEKMHDQGRADLRDAIAILTPDQQAQGWEMMAEHAAQHGGRGGPGMGAPPNGDHGMGPGAPHGRDGRPGNRPPGDEGAPS